MSGSVAERIVWTGSVGAAVLAVHAAVNGRLLRRPPTTPHAGRWAVSVLIPARNEADRLGPTLAAVLEQEGVEVEVLVLDDGSTDDTQVVARGVADGDPRFRLLEGKPLPNGWLGKPFACWQLAQVARHPVLVFLDADVVLQPGALADCADLLAASGLDLVSPYPRQVAEGVAERLIQPLLQWSWLSFLPLRLAERTRAESMTAGNGQLLVTGAAAYRAAGGHQQVRSAVIEDVELARAFKRVGLGVGMADGTDLATCRMYDGWGELRAGYTKSLWAAFGSRGGAAAIIGLLVLLYLIPPVGLVVGLLGRRPALATAGGVGYLSGVAGRAVAARRTGGRVADAPAHPVSIGLLTYLVVLSWVRRSRGALSWKGRPVS